MNRIVAALVALLALASPALADIGVTTSGSTTVVDFDAAHSGTARCAAASTHCPAAVLIDSAGAEKGTNGNPLSVTVTNTPAVSQSGTWNVTNISGTVSLPTGAATAANQTSANTKLDTIITNTGAGALIDETAFTEGTTSSILFGGYFKTAPTALTTGQSGALTVTADRKLITSPYADYANFSGSASQSSAMTGTASTSLLAAPGANLRWYITAFTCSDSHATVGTDVILQDGSGGTQLWLIPASPNFGGAVQTLPSTIKQPTINTALFVQNVTTGANTKCSVAAFKGV